MSSLLAPCPRPLLSPSVCSPFFWYLLHKKPFTHSSATFLRHSKKGRILVISSSSLRALHSAGHEAMNTAYSAPCAFIFFFCVFLVYLDCRKWGKAEYVQFHNVSSHLGLNTVSQKTLNVELFQRPLNLSHLNNYFLINLIFFISFWYLTDM